MFLVMLPEQLWPGSSLPCPRIWAQHPPMVCMRYTGEPWPLPGSRLPLGHGCQGSCCDKSGSQSWGLLPTPAFQSWVGRACSA